MWILTSLRADTRRRRDIAQWLVREFSTRVNPGPHLLAQQSLIRIDPVPEDIIRVPDVVVHDLVGAKVRPRVVVRRIATAELAFEPLGHHC